MEDGLGRARADFAAALRRAAGRGCRPPPPGPPWSGMAEITWFFAYRHLRSEASSHVITFRRGQRVRSGRGLAFWFRPDRTSIAEVPADDRDTDFVFQARSRDYQVVTVQGTITWRAAEPEALASRVDFTIDLRTGRLRTDPLDRIASLLIGLA